MSGWWCGFFVFRVVSVFSDLLFYNRWNLQLPLFLRNLCNCWYGVGVDPQFREEKRYENELGQGKKTHTPVTRHSEALLGSSMAESARWRGKKRKNKLNEGRERLGVEGESERNIKKGEGKRGERIGGGGWWWTNFRRREVLVVAEEGMDGLELVVASYKSGVGQTTACVSFCDICNLSLSWVGDEWNFGVMWGALLSLTHVINLFLFNSETFLFFSSSLANKTTTWTWLL